MKININDPEFAKKQQKKNNPQNIIQTRKQQVQKEQDLAHNRKAEAKRRMGEISSKSSKSSIANIMAASRKPLPSPKPLALRTTKSRRKQQRKKQQQQRQQEQQQRQQQQQRKKAAAG